MPVPADDAWLQGQVSSLGEMIASSQEEAAAAAQGNLDRFASIDGEVWQAADAPVYRAPTPEDAPFAAPLRVDVVPAPDTTSSAAGPGFFHSDAYDDAVATVWATAKATGAPVSPSIDPVPPIAWMREIDLVGAEPEWRQGHELEFPPSDTLNEFVFRDRLAAFREQIVGIPGAVTGDVGSFLVVGDWRLDFAALTRHQQDEYRRYIIYGVEHGLI